MSCVDTMEGGGVQLGREFHAGAHGMQAFPDRGGDETALTRVEARKMALA